MSGIAARACSSRRRRGSTATRASGCSCARRSPSPSVRASSTTIGPSCPIAAGIAANDERNVDADPTQNLEALFTLRQSYYRYDRPKTNVDAGFQYYPSLSNWGRQRIQLDASARREVLKDFFLAINMFDTFDSRPPSPDAAKNDVGVSFSIGWSY